MSGQLQIDDGEGPARCSYCSNEAAGPCATCHKPVCGNCCTLTEGGVRTWAICLDCDRKKGSSLTNAWRSFGFFVVAILVVMAAIVALLAWLSPVSPKE